MEVNTDKLVKGLKVAATVVTSLTVFYGFIYAIGLAPLTNGQAQSIIDSRVKAEVKEQQDRMQEVERQVKTLNDSAVRIDERTRMIQESLQNLNSKFK